MAAGEQERSEQLDLRPAASALERFDACPELLGYARRHRDALQATPSVGFPGVAARTGVAAVAGTASVDSLEASDASGADAPATPAGSGTNVQEAGVDEPDVVKASGDLILALAGQELHAVDAAGDPPTLAGTLRLPEAAGGRRTFGHELLVSADRALVLSQVRLRGFRPGTLLTEVDLSDPSAMRVVRTYKAEGAYVSARLTGTSARVVVSTQPAYPVRPAPRRPRAAPEARGPAPESGPAWMPAAVVRDGAGERVARRPLVSCHDVRRSRRFSGLGMLTVLTVDLAGGLPPVDSDAVMTSGELVYASEDALYVATEGRPTAVPLGASRVGPQLEPREEAASEVHKFDISEPDRTEYRASGEVPGFLLNQFSMSEHQGGLRVASTMDPFFASRRSESFVTVLEERSRRLVQVGQVGGLGRGERVYAVRFLGDVGFVVTFRQIDPLYTLDLSSPIRPRVLGELKIRGYSSYLHPLGGDLLLGVGQDATRRGRLTGAQLSLFDVSDPSEPVRVASRTVAPGASSEAELDHHAFLYWPPEELAVVPVRLRGPSGPFAGAVGFRVAAANGIEELGRISHGGARVLRALVVEDRLFTLSRQALVAHDLETLEDETRVALGSTGG